MEASPRCIPWLHRQNQQSMDTRCRSAMSITAASNHRGAADAFSQAPSERRGVQLAPRRTDAATWPTPTQRGTTPRSGDPIVQATSGIRENEPPRQNHNRDRDDVRQQVGIRMRIHSPLLPLVSDHANSRTGDQVRSVRAKNRRREAGSPFSPTTSRPSIRSTPMRNTRLATSAI